MTQNSHKNSSHAINRPGKAPRPQPSSRWRGRSARPSPGAGSRPGPGCHPQPTSWSSRTCVATSSSVRPPVRAGILDLRADFGRRHLPPHHLGRRQAPVLGARRAMQLAGIAGEMTARAAQARIAETTAVVAPLDIEAVHPGDAVMRAGPARPVVGDMAVGAARMRKDRIDLAPFAEAAGRVRRRRGRPAACSPRPRLASPQEWRQMSG